MKEIEFEVDGNLLNGTVIAPEKLESKNPGILFIQGWTGEKERSYQYASALANLGFISFLYDARGHGTSLGDINTATTKEFLADAVAAYDYLTNIEGLDVNNISVVGSSFGGYMAALLTTERDIKKVVLRAAADYPNESFIKSKMQTSGSDNPTITAWRGQVRKPADSFALDAISKFNGNILILESEKDDTIPHQTLQNYIDAAPNKSKLEHVVVKGAPHSISEGPFRDKIEQILVGWFSKTA